MNKEKVSGNEAEENWIIEKDGIYYETDEKTFREFNNLNDAVDKSEWKYCSYCKKKRYIHEDGFCSFCGNHAGGQ